LFEPKSTLLSLPLPKKATEFIIGVIFIVTFGEEFKNGEISSHNEFNSTNHHHYRHYRHCHQN
jgi:hypothetical protein